MTSNIIYMKSKSRKKAIVMRSCVLFYGALHGGRDQGCQNAYNSGLPSAAFFFTFLCNTRYHSYLHAKFQEDLPKKKLKTFHLKICCILFGSPCTKKKKKTVENVLPAEPLEQHVVALSAEFDPPEQPHWRVPPLVVLKHDAVEVLDGDPTEDGPRLLHVRVTARHQHPNQIGEGLLVFLGDADGAGVDVLEHLGVSEGKELRVRFNRSWSILAG